MSDADDADGVAPDAIRHLDERTVQRIAAGEVVERPASVVKELVENSLDADASRVSVAVESGGKGGVRVRDDGVGIPGDQLADAVAEHATSKIADIDDVEEGVATLGFRGEALSTIGAVSRLTVRSRPRGGERGGRASETAGAEITVDGGDVGEVRPAGCPTGTTVEVEDLFYNTPAREKFLKADATEFDHVNTVVTQYALANPDVAVSLEHDGRETFATDGNGDLRSAVLAVYGREVAEAMVDVSWEPDADRAAETSVRRVHGLVSHPETTRASRDYLATFVNDRYVTATVLRNAVVDAYGGQLAPDRYPFAVLFVEMPPAAVDVNVHPRKLEVRFDEESAVSAAVEEAVEGALLDHGLIRSTAPRGRSAPDEARIEPEPDDTEVVGGSGTRGGRATADSTARSEADAPGNASDAAAGRTEVAGASDAAGGDDGPDDGASLSGSEEGVGDEDAGAVPGDPTTARELDADDADAWTVEGLGGGPSVPETDVETGSGDGASELAAGSDGSPFGSDDGSSTDASAAAGGTPAGSATGPASEQEAAKSNETAGGGDVPDHNAARTETERPSPREWQTDVDEGAAAGDQRTLAGGETAVERAYESLPSLRVLGQLHDTYVVAEASDGLVLIDQHAADERVNYERLRRRVADGADSQALAEPVTIELTAREAALFEEFVDDLAAIGFRAERASEREVSVSAVPAVFDATLDPELLRDVLGSFVGEAADDAELVEDVIDEFLADLACYPSVTGNTSLTEGSVVDLLSALDDCENPYACPHGRPVVIAFDRADIEDRFERDYPGHAGRRAE